MKLHILGIGHSSTQLDFHSNFFLSYQSLGLLIDAGTTLRYSLPKNNISLKQITHIIITHFHHDHVGGLSELLNTMYWQFEGNQHTPLKPTLIMRREQFEDIASVLSPTLNNQGLVWHDYCHVTFFEHNHFQYEDLQFTCIVTDDLHCPGLQSFGLHITSPDRNILISGDIKQIEQSTLKHYINEQTACIIQDVALCPNPVHTTLAEVEHYYPAALHDKIYAVHYDEPQNIETAIRFAKSGDVL